MGAGFVRIVTEASFERDVLRAARPVLVAFGTSWCGPCKLMAPGLRALAATHKDALTVAKLDVDANPDFADAWKVETYPVSILFRDGAEVARLDGYMALRKLEAALAPHLDAP
ncbi:MAG TPA: thioredoxin family protein [Allosphingosinicella sp.]|nr:thioredoxin family protein [Allosphingosinicella sp.]